MSFEHFYKQSDAIKFSSCLILLSKRDTKKPIRSWASFQMFFPTAHIFPEVTLPLPSIKSPNNCMFIISGGGHFSHCLHADEKKQYVLAFSSSIPTVEWGHPALTLSPGDLSRMGSSHPSTDQPGLANQHSPSSRPESSGMDSHGTPAGRPGKEQFCFPGTTLIRCKPEAA